MGNVVQHGVSAGRTDLACDIDAGLGRATELIEASHAPATIAAYRSGVAAWTAWAQHHGVTVFPVEPTALAAYVGHLEQAGKSASTIARRCAAIAHWHRHYGHHAPTDDPMVRRLLKGLRKSHAGEQSPKKAFTADLVRHFIAHESTSIRDRALVAVAFVTGLRRSELVAISWGDLSECPDTAGLILHIRKSKADQTGKGAYVAIPRVFGPVDPAGLLLAWRHISQDSVRVFPLSVSTVLRVAKRIATLAGLDPADYGAHSLRSGLCTVAARAGVSLAESMQASRHKSADTAAKYVRSIQASENRAHLAAARALSGE